MFDYPAGILSLIFLLAGIFFLVSPQTVRKYDNRMTRFIKNEDEYIFTIKIFGIIAVMIALIIGLFFIFGLVF